MAISASWLAGKVESRHLMPFKFASQLFLVDGRSAVYWPEQDLLIVSDLHLEKGSYLGRFANPIPHYDSRKTLSALTVLLRDYTPRTVVCLGDSFHDLSAYKRMPQEEKLLLTRLVNSVEKWVWVLGNHDPALPEEVGGEQKVSWLVQGIYLVHEPLDRQSGKERAQIIGHYHPKAVAKSKRLKVRGKCLLLGPYHAVMPAFGQYTGGLDIEDDVYKEVLGVKPSHGFVLSEDCVFPLNQRMTSLR